MRRLFILIALLALAVPASATAATQWRDYPTCTATATTLTCTGTAVGIPHQSKSPFDPSQKYQVQAFVTTQTRWICATGAEVFSFQYAFVEVSNGETFTISLTADRAPNVGMFPWCMSEEFPTRDPNFYRVTVDIGWVDITQMPPPLNPLYFALMVLTAPVGTVSPS